MEIALMLSTPVLLHGIGVLVRGFSRTRELHRQLYYSRHYNLPADRPDVVLGQAIQCLEQLLYRQLTAGEYRQVAKDACGVVDQVGQQRTGQSAWKA